ncbi:unnamed protein product [Arabidopsis thaliana]|uniref:(thale cress) hypothetical protein n=1 Tax=Arabidopsis thaliana TaxID=3702 RepID=A0A7G2EP04_ARATH|nr:unnamed protein product [Arabidopsis thaliana]
MLGNKPVLQHILKPFQQKTGTMLTKIQFKNHWDKIVRQWKIWCRLVQCSHITYEMGSSDKDVWCQYSRLGQLFTVSVESSIVALDLEFIFEGTSGSKKKRRCNHPDEDTQSASKAYWSSSSHELLVDLLFQESLKGNIPIKTRGYSHYPKETWNMMVESLNQKTGLGYTREQHIMASCSRILLLVASLSAIFDEHSSLQVQCETLFYGRLISRGLEQRFGGTIVILPKRCVPYPFPPPHTEKIIVFGEIFEALV